MWGLWSIKWFERDTAGWRDSNTEPATNATALTLAFTLGLRFSLFISDMDVIKISRHHHIVIFIMALAIESLVGVGHRLMLCACVERGTPSISGMQRCPRMGVPRHLCQSMPWV